MMGIFTFRIHMYNIINGIVEIKFMIFSVKEGYQFQSFFDALQSMVLCGEGGVEEAEGGSPGNEVYGCVGGWYYLAPHHFANV